MRSTADANDMQGRQARAHVSVTLIGGHDESAGLGHGKVGTGHSGVGGQKSGPGSLAHRLGQVMRIGVLRVCSNVLGEEGSHVGTELMVLIKDLTPCA